MSNDRASVWSSFIAELEEECEGENAGEEDLGSDQSGEASSSEASPDLATIPTTTSPQWRVKGPQLFAFGRATPVETPGPFVTTLGSFEMVPNLLAEAAPNAGAWGQPLWSQPQNFSGAAPNAGAWGQPLGSQPQNFSGGTRGQPFGRGGAPDLARADVSERKEPPPPPVPLPRSMPLFDWVLHHANIRRHEQKGTGGNKRSGRGGLDRSPDKVYKDYLEKAVNVALSLAVKLKQQPYAVISIGEITMSHIMLNDTQEGDADFKMSRREGGDHPTKNCTNESSPRNQRPIICALGRLFYEIFTQGLSPPPPGGTLGSSSDNPTSSSFRRVLTISDEADGGEDDEDRHRRRRRRRDDLPGKKHSARSALGDKGLPAPLIALLADMLEDEDEGGLFHSDSAISTLDDVISDLRAMREDPDSFLHESLLGRSRPEFRDRMYGREVELGRAAEAADRVAPPLKADSHRPRPKDVLMVSGHSGSGKSCLVQELSAKLLEKGWHYLSCKFDNVQPRPLSFIISAFERHFAELAAHLDGSTTDDHGGLNEIEALRMQITQSLDEHNLSVLCRLMPSVRHLVSREGGLMADDEFPGCTVDSSDMASSKSRLHRLFGLLIKAMSRSAPILFFLDDLHWSDQDSLDLVLALVRGVGDEMDEETETEVNVGHGVLFVGAYRTNEVSDGDPLSASLRLVRNLTDVGFTEISLGDLPSEGVNLMVSEALRYPKRLTRTLSEIVYRKTAGNPLFLKEFLNDLVVDNLLTYSLLLKKWEWNEDLIEVKTISDGVAELLTRKLLRLPGSVLSALRVVAVFGSQVSAQVLLHVKDVCGNTDITTKLDRAMEESLLKKTADGYAFVHDLIEESVRASIDPDEMPDMLMEIAETLLARTTENRANQILFVIVDFINRAGADVASADDRMRYAHLNLTCGKKAIQCADFGSACSYIESGISFLSPDSWSTCYGLSLALFKNAASSHYAQGNLNIMRQRLDEVLDNATTFEDKLDSLCLEIHAMCFSSTLDALEKSFFVLEQLGESFPASPDNSTIVEELSNVKEQLEQYSPTTLSEIPPMKDPRKIRAMEVLQYLLMACHRLKSQFYPLVCCRMTKISLQYGMHMNTALGFCGLACAYANIFQDVSEGWNLGKYALAITTNKNLAAVYLTLHGMISVWKQPVQAILPELLRAYKVGMKIGQISDALLSSMLYLARAFFSGSNLLSLGKEMSFFIHQNTIHRRYINITILPMSNTIMSLTGNCFHKKMDIGKGPDSEDSILSFCLQKKDVVVCETIIVCKMMRSFIFRDLDYAGKVAHQYLDFLEEHDGGIGSLQFISIYRYFYGGLIAFDCFRRTKDQYWKKIGMRSIGKFEMWTKECEWNFRNKLLLLEAEHHFSEGNFTNANDTYDLAIMSADDHRFIHEKALACELAGTFHCVLGNEEQSTDLFQKALEHYRAWGARLKLMPFAEH